MARIRGNGPRYASDANYHLIEMWKALQDDWIPPSVVTEAEYQQAKEGKFEPALTAFIGLGCSFGDKWFGGYARDDRGDNYALQSKNSLLFKVSKMKDVVFFDTGFMEWFPNHYGSLVYCDPPYFGTSGYKGVKGKFDSLAFWQRIRELESRGHTCVISEYQAPSDFTCVWSQPTKTEMRTKANGREARVEKLFRLGEHAPVQYNLF